MGGILSPIVEGLSGALTLPTTLHPSNLGVGPMVLRKRPREASLSVSTAFYVTVFLQRGSMGQQWG